MRKLCLSAKFLHQKIRWNDGILRSELLPIESQRNFEETPEKNFPSRINSGRAVAKSIAAIEQFVWIIEWCEQRWRRKWWYYLQNFQDPLNRTELMEKCGDWVQWYMLWIYRPKVLWQERDFRRWWLFCSIYILSWILRSDFHSAAHSGA